jgi:hypothetical protein
MLDCGNACVVCCLQADATQKPTPRSYRQAACLVAAQALVPCAAAAAAGVPTQVVLSVHQPRVIIVRRFMNNVLYVMAMMSHELDAAGSAQQGQQQPKPQPQPQPASRQQSHAAATPTAVFLFTLTGVQVGALRVHRQGRCLRRLGCIGQVPLYICLGMVRTRSHMKNWLLQYMQAWAAVCISSGWLLQEGKTAAWSAYV